MTIYWIYIATCLIAVIAVLRLTPLVKAAALKLKKLDAPCERKIHQQPMVRLGGIAIFSATVFSLFCIGSLACVTDVLKHFTQESVSTIFLLIAGGSGFFLIGLADDLLDLSPFNRLWMQGAIASLVWSFGIQINTLTIPGIAEPISLGWLSLPITVFWIAGVVNAINWIDGLDGLATGVSSIAVATLVVLGMALSQPVLAIVGAALLGSLLGFLVYNYSPATIFMGDGGSYFIGFILASLCIVGSQHLSSPFATLLPLIVLAIPLGDMTYVILSRIYRKQSPFSADNLHLHHRLLRQEMTHETAVWIIYVLTLATGSLALVLAGLAGMLTLFTGLAILLCFLVWQVSSVAILFRESNQLSKQPSQHLANLITRKDLWYSKNP
ncbi:MAG: MraY family glycosyltransferase [Phormidesmis sp.]